MKSNKATIFVLVIALLLLNVTYGCGILPESISKPTVGYIPQEWYLSDEEPYDTFKDSDGTKWGFIEYTDTVDLDFVQIFYGDVPPSLRGREHDMVALLSNEHFPLRDIDETGTMFLVGELAAWGKVRDILPGDDVLGIIFIKGSTCINIFASYAATEENEAQVMSLIRSIDLEPSYRR